MPDSPNFLWGYQWPYNHFDLNIPPKPREPDASVCNSTNSESTQSVAKKNRAPFQLQINCCHMVTFFKKKRKHN